MSFEYHNPHSCAIDCTCALPIGTIRIMPGQALPTPEQEEEGITAELLRQFAIPNLLHPTPPTVRRRLFQENDLPVPKDIVNATAHLVEFGGDGGQGDAGEPKKAPLPPPALKKRPNTKHEYPGQESTKLPGTGIDTSEMERVISSRPKKVSDPQ